MNRIISAFLAISAALMPAAAQTTQRLTATKANEYALVYTLPNTILDITIETERVVKKPGELYQYANKYLQVNDPVMKPSETVTVKSVTIVPRGVANPDEKYAVKFSAGNPPFMILDSQNLPISVNTEKSFTPAAVKLPEPQAAQPTPLESPAARQAMTPDMLKSTSVAKRAELAAETIYSLRESRNEIITGQSEQSFPDGAALQLALDNINAQEAALTAMFVGTEQRSTDVATVSYMPDVDTTDYVVARVSTKGVVPATDLSGEPIYLSVSITDSGEIPVNDKGVELPFPKGGFAYAIPGKAIVKISYDGKTLAEETKEFAQFGLVYGLAPGLFTDKKAPMYMIMDPSTGAVRELGPVTPEE